MGIEIERKFLVVSDAWRPLVVGQWELTQGYMPTQASASIRVRIRDRHAFLTVKLGKDVLSRSEFEYEIPFHDGEVLLAEACGFQMVRKRRFEIPSIAGLKWEIDQFDGRLVGLILAEIELPEANFPLIMPDWIGADVTADLRFLNENLCSLDHKDLSALLCEYESD